MHGKKPTQLDDIDLSEDEEEPSQPQGRDPQDGALQLPTTNQPKTAINDDAEDGGGLTALEQEGFRASGGASSVYVKKFHDPFADATIKDDHMSSLKRKKTIVAEAPDRLFVAQQL